MSTPTNSVRSSASSGAASHWNWTPRRTALLLTAGLLLALGALPTRNLLEDARPAAPPTRDWPASPHVMTAGPALAFAPANAPPRQSVRPAPRTASPSGDGLSLLLGTTLIAIGTLFEGEHRRHQSFVEATRRGRF